MSWKAATIAAAVVLAVYLLSRSARAAFDPFRSPRANAIEDEWGKDAADAARYWGIPERRILAIIAQESLGDPNARASAGEVGLMQITPIAFRDFQQWAGTNFGNVATVGGIEIGKPLADILSDGRANIFTGTGYLKTLMQRHRLTLDQATEAYNTGPDREPRAAAERYLAAVKQWEQYFW